MKRPTRKLTQSGHESCYLDQESFRLVQCSPAQCLYDSLNLVYIVSNGNKLNDHRESFLQFSKKLWSLDRNVSLATTWPLGPFCLRGNECHEAVYTLRQSDSAIDRKSTRLN